MWKPRLLLNSFKTKLPYCKIDYSSKIQKKSKIDYNTVSSIRQVQKTSLKDRGAPIKSLA